MTEVSCCDNHTCNAQFDKAQDEYVTCSLCRQPAYCSDECRLMDWRTHDCANVHKTESLKAGLAVPYFYEDMLTAEELESVPVDDPIFQQYQVMHCNTNRTISQYIIPSLVEKNAESKDDEAPIARGKAPKALTASNYKLRIQIGSNGRVIDVDGLIPTDMIFKENDKNPTAQALSGGGATFKDRARNVFRGGLRRALHHAETSYIFWPPNHRLRQQLVETDLAGDISVWLIVKDANGKERTVSDVHAGYKLPIPGKNDASAAARKVQQLFRSQVEMKFKGSDLSTKNLYVRRYSDFEGNGIILTFEITPGSYKAKLVDIEYIVDAERFKSGDVLTEGSKGSGLVKSLKDAGIDSDDETAPPPPPPDTEAEIVASRFACDVRSMEDVAGLVMELDTFIATQALLPHTTSLRDLDNKAAIIKEYAHKMEENRGQAPETIPPEVDAAVAGALSALYEPIGMSQSQWDKKAMGTFDNFKADVDRIIARIKELRAASAQDDPSRAKGKLKRGLRTVFQKKPLLADLDRILKAIDKRTGSFGEDGASQETKDKWNALRESVVQAKRSGTM